MSKRDIYCRACLRQVEGNIADLAVTSYDIFLTENFCEKYVQSTNQPSVPWDEYSHTVCGNCYEKVLDIHQFQVMCRESLEKFKIIMQSPKSQATPNSIYQQEISESTSCTENNISELTNVDPSAHDADLLLDEIENRHTECTPPLENKCETDTLKKLQGDDVNLIDDIFVNNKIFEILKEANCNGYDIDITDYNELLDNQEDNINEMEDEFLKCNDECTIVLERSETLDDINEVEEEIAQGEEVRIA